MKRLLFAAFLFVTPAVSAQTIYVMPYLQPGDGSTLIGSDVKVIRWLTDQTPGSFTVEYQLPDGTVRQAKIARVSLEFDVAKKPVEKPKEPAKDAKPEPNEKEKEKEKDKAKDPKSDKKDADKGPEDDFKEPKVPSPPEKHQQYYRYTAQLEGLPFNSDIRYRVKLSDKIVREATFRSRATADKSVRCVLVGDMATGRPQQRAVAYRIAQEKPEFLVALGDIVYPTGRVNQYMAYYWGVYNNVPQADIKTGAPLMASVPFYPVLGNHDISAKLSNAPDALGAYYFFAPPRNGPGEGAWCTPLGAKSKSEDMFRAATGDSYGYIDAYSYDYGPAHFTVLNSNRPFTDTTLNKWLRDDLTAAKGKWKFVCYHHPGFHSSKAHYTDQQARRLQPIFEECGVDITFCGHVHNYQRSVPLKFTSGKITKNRVDGTFTLDTTFDGIKNTQPSGVIHIVAGGGGAGLYGPGLDKTVEYLKKTYKGNYDEFTAKMVADQHSFVVLDLAPDRVHFRAISAGGEELDRMTITKAK